MTTFPPYFVKQVAERAWQIKQARKNILNYADFIDIPGKPITEDDDCDIFTPIESKIVQHHRLILTTLDRVSNTRHGRCMFFMPPGSAKSTYASVVFPSQFIGRKKNQRFILASYGDTLAKKMGKRTRAILRQGRYKQVFNTEMHKDSQAANEFSLTNGSEYMACGILAGVTGNRAHGIIIDDPIKGREDADSVNNRDKTWSAYEDDLKTRLVPGGWIAIIQCMVGDTNVLMEDGSVKFLEDIRPGDIVATYDNGNISTAKVLNWKSQGCDCVFTITMKSGITVTANERHPFLVKRNGAVKWIKVQEIKQGDLIVSVRKIRRGEVSARMMGAPAQHTPGEGVINTTKEGLGKTPWGTKENGQELSAPTKVVINQRSAKGVVHHTTTKQNGQVGIGPLASMQYLEETATSNTDMASPLMSTKPLTTNKEAGAQCVDNCRGRMLGRTGEVSSVLTIATTQVKSEGYCATTATLPLVMEKQRKYCSTPLNMCEIICDEVVSISKAGKREVFDIQVEGTENFIANGLVSHNTRWHEDDLSGRILPDNWKGESGEILCKDDNIWTVVCLQARCEVENDPLGRKQGEYLWPEWFDQKHWAQFESNPRTWSALYQQLPSPLEGNFFKPSMIEILPAEPVGVSSPTRAWDLAATKNDGDWTAGAKLAKMADGRTAILDLEHVQEGPDGVQHIIKNTADRDGYSTRIRLPQDPGQAGKSQVATLAKLLVGYTVIASPVTGSKETRASGFAAQVNVGNVCMVKAAWNQKVIEELRTFPNAAHDDIVDSMSDAFNDIHTKPTGYFSA